MKESFVLFKSHYDIILELPMEQRGELLTALFEWQTSGETPEIKDVATRIVFKSIQATVMAADKKYAETVERRKEAGAKGGLAKSSKAKQNVANDSKDVAKSSKAKQSVANCSIRLDMNRLDMNRYDNDNDNNIPSASALDYWEQNMGLLNPVLVENIKDLADEVGLPVFIKAVDKSIVNNKRSFAYVQSVARGIASGNDFDEVKNKGHDVWSEALAAIGGD